MLDTLQTFGRCAIGVRQFLSVSPGPAECRRIVADQKARRSESFLAMLEREKGVGADIPSFRSEFQI